MANADFTAICSIGPEKYDNQKWEVVVYESGTTIVIPKGLEKASHFLIYGPKVEPEASRDNLRHKRAEELAKFLNTNARPKWMVRDPKIEYLCQMTVPDGTEISCVSTTCGESEACALFNWFRSQLAGSFVSDAISSEMDKKCLEFMIEAGKHANEATQVGASFKNVDIDDLVRLRKEIDDTTHLGPITNIQVFKEARPEAVKFLNMLGAGLQGKSIPVRDNVIAPPGLTINIPTELPPSFMKDLHAELADASDSDIDDINAEAFSVIAGSVKHMDDVSSRQEQSQVLKPCPFCGGHAQMSSCADYDKVFCTSCFASTNENRKLYMAAEDRKQAARDSWNQRT